MKVYIHTFGCKVNSFESAAMSEKLSKSGFEIVYDSGGADIVVVNSCTVTANGDRKVAQFIRSIKRNNPETIVVLSGCMPQAYPDKADTIDGADIITGTGNRLEITDILNTFISTRSKIVSVDTKAQKDFEPLGTEYMDSHTRAFMKIEDGCDRFCSYCIIPFSRGNVRSMPLSDIEKQARSYAQKGYREIVISGINLSLFGRGTETSLYDAVNLVASVDGIERVRLGSLEPDLLSDELLTKLALIEKLCPHFHLSLQSGCDTTLARMNRPYDTALFSAVAERISNLFDRPTFTTDVIVGYPGETQQEFEQSLGFVKNFGFLKVHVFPYSVRPGTVAANSIEQIPATEKKRRAALMTAAADEAREQVLKSFIGKQVRVIAEQPKNGGFEGYTDRYLPAIVLGSDIKTGDLVRGVAEKVEGGLCKVKI